ncbi:MAG: hypothetical protein QHH06_11670 [Clostridiales bacterium]|jgi:hypothetical protein|nr:hypothetical protein [Eubacteriales bacterium]MDH7567119.1 hypothetical protein [Clostridiales bacterium]
MTNSQRIRQALKLIEEVKEDTAGDEMLQTIIEGQLKALENLEKWLKSKS